MCVEIIFLIDYILRNHKIAMLVVNNISKLILVEELLQERRNGFGPKSKINCIVVCCPVSGFQILACGRVASFHYLIKDITLIYYIHECIAKVEFHTRVLFSF